MEKIDKKSKRRPKLLKIILLSLLGFLALLIIAAFITGITSSPEEIKARNERIKERELKELKEEEEKNRKHYSKYDALSNTQSHIEEHLKSPGSAEFDSSLDGVIQVNDTIFTVKSYVDSQNGFGALLRTHYSCRIVFHPKTETYNVENLTME